MSLLSLTALVALSITTAMLWRDVGPLRAEVQRLRREAGVLTVSDPDLVHAIGVETYVTNAWKWRLWVPANRRVALHVSVSGVPNPHVFYPSNGSPYKTMPEPAGRLELDAQNAEGAEIEVTLAAERKLDGTVRWLLHDERGVTIHLPVPPEADKWLVDRASGSSGGGRVGIHVKELPDTPLVLLHKRVYYQRDQIPPPNASETGDGVIAWIEAIP
ncbi:hypothetical protein [Botrimarina colliarenosi]|uniref:hypothetical protein n=1 Tax=Botrimarina colliarenosi TaxID=2528001 RepID=UPI0018D34B2D|nr:hypothetical protein [Botrimarina colliarenosi]